MNHQALIERSHKQAVDKGFWEQPLTFDMAMALIISEIAEALEAFRKGRVNPDLSKVKPLTDSEDSSNLNSWSDTQAVKDSFEVELADAIIRIYDWAGGNNLDLEIEDIVLPWKEDGADFMRLFTYCTDLYLNYMDGDRLTSMEVLAEVLYSYCKYKEIDIERFILWKLDYNLSRPFKHGKQF